MKARQVRLPGVALGTRMLTGSPTQTFSDTPAVGVMAYASDIAADFWAVVGALVLSLLVSLAFAGWLMQKLIERQQRREDV